MTQFYGNLSSRISQFEGVTIELHPEAVQLLDEAVGIERAVAYDNRELKLRGGKTGVSIHTELAIHALEQDETKSQVRNVYTATLSIDGKPSRVAEYLYGVEEFVNGTGELSRLTRYTKSADIISGLDRAVYVTTNRDFRYFVLVNSDGRSNTIRITNHFDEPDVGPRLKTGMEDIDTAREHLIDVTELMMVVLLRDGIRADWIVEEKETLFTVHLGKTSLVGSIEDYRPGKNLEADDIPMSGYTIYPGVSEESLGD